MPHLTKTPLPSVCTENIRSSTTNLFIIGVLPCSYSTIQWSNKMQHVTIRGANIVIYRYITTILCHRASKSFDSKHERITYCCWDQRFREKASPHPKRHNCYIATNRPRSVNAASLPEPYRPISVYGRRQSNPHEHIRSDVASPIERATPPLDENRDFQSREAFWLF